MTKQRAAVVSVLQEIGEFRSAQQLHDVLREQGEAVGLATVYRTLQTLAESRDVDVLRAEDGEALYRWCTSRKHHHHLVCRQCGHTVEIDGPTVEAWTAMIGQGHCFTDISHTIELWGICEACRSGG
ncbi:MAG: transcriptional repressor [Promicromonosporaceae bacterium]|nr:transcriptional repressor [Promicromonosporaceae bacterium]